MPMIDRRRVLGLALGAVGAVSTATEPGARTRRPPAANSRPATEPPPAHRTESINPVLFWNDVALQLDALDHSIDAKDARAPGPCASSRALALAHIVMADAVAASYDCNFEGLYVRGGRRQLNEYAAVFVGGATARILGHIYSTPAHTHLIGSRRMRFLESYDSRTLAAWNAGLEFGGSERFTSHWHWPKIKTAALSSLRRGHSLSYGEHDVDPFNTDQKFYGVNWGRVPPLLAGLPVASLEPGAPPREHDREYRRDWEEVRELGAYRPEGPTKDQVKVGLFWAYDGARLLGTPPRLYNQLIAQILKGDSLSTPEMARALALCNLAMAEAGIVCWSAKYRYKIWRPVIGIPKTHYHPDRHWRPFGAPRTNHSSFALGDDGRRLTALSMIGGGERRWTGEPVRGRLPYDRACFTPNFPSYPSGHATFGSASLNILKRVRAEREPGDRNARRLDIGPFVSEELNGVSIDNFRNVPRPYVPLKYTDIDRMIEDNNKSRVHLGVHWSFDCELGAESGARIAGAVYRSAYRIYRRPRRN